MIPSIFLLVRLLGEKAVYSPGFGVSLPVSLSAETGFSL